MLRKVLAITRSISRNTSIHRLFPPPLSVVAFSTATSTSASESKTAALSGLSTDEFTKTLHGLDRRGLGIIDVRSLPKPLRRILDAERCKRKAQAKSGKSGEGKTNGATTDAGPPASSEKATKPSSSNTARVTEKEEPSSSKTEKGTGGDKVTRPKIPRHSMFPELHHLITAQLPEEYLDFHPEDNGYRAEEEPYDTNLVGTFICPKCNKTWSSGIIHTIIRKYHLAYNARVYHQRCKRCNSIARPKLDEGLYAARVGRRLKIWLDYDVDRVERRGLVETQGPHDEDRCEGCRAGRCRKGKASLGY